MKPLIVGNWKMNTSLDDAHRLIGAMLPALRELAERADVVAEQLEAALEDVTLDARLAIAYEPVWTTIGMVQSPPPSYVGEMCNHIRQTLRDLFPRQATQEVRVIYGGSVAPRNLDAILAE